MIFRKDTWIEILGSVSKNKVRTTITVIGVLWGIFIYIVLSGAAKGLDNGFERQFKRVAMNSMFAWAQQTSVPYEGFKTGRQLQLKLGNVATLKNKIPEIQFIAPRNAKGVFDGEAPTISRNQKSGQYNIYGDFPVLLKIATKDIYDGGRFLNYEDIKLMRKVCVIGERTKKELFAAKYLQNAISDSRINDDILLMYERLYGVGVVLKCLENYDFENVEYRDKEMAKRFLDIIKEEKADKYLIYAGNMHFLRKSTQILGFKINPVPIYLPKTVVNNVLTI